MDSRALGIADGFVAETAELAIFSRLCRRARAGAKALARTKPLENATEGPAR